MTSNVSFDFFDFVIGSFNFPTYLIDTPFIMGGPNDRKLSSTLTKNLSMFKFVEGGRESMRAGRY